MDTKAFFLPLGFLRGIRDTKKNRQNPMKYQEIRISQERSAHSSGPGDFILFPRPPTSQSTLENDDDSSRNYNSKKKVDGCQFPVSYRVCRRLKVHSLPPETFGSRTWTDSAKTPILGGQDTVEKVWGASENDWRASCPLQAALSPTLPSKFDNGDWVNGKYIYPPEGEKKK